MALPVTHRRVTPPRRKRRGWGRVTQAATPPPPCSAPLSLPARSRVSTPVKRKTKGEYRDYGNGQINAYPPPNPAASNAVMMSLAEELLTKKGLSLKVRARAHATAGG